MLKEEDDDTDSDEEDEDDNDDDNDDVCTTSRDLTYFSTEEFRSSLSVRFHERLTEQQPSSGRF